MNSRIVRMFLILAVAAMIFTPARAGEPSSAEAAKAGFDKLKSLAGQWETKTSDGKKAVLTMEVLAEGSAILEREVVESDAAHSSMLTLYHLDNGRLLLTHYCMAGNQPRMLADSYNPQSGTLRFNFLDATNLATPNDGHMRNVVFRFVDANHFAARWTFFKDQKEVFAEEFQYTRLAGSAK